MARLGRYGVPRSEFLAMPYRDAVGLAHAIDDIEHDEAELQIELAKLVGIYARGGSVS